jgi:hypothetical protein
MPVAEQAFFHGTDSNVSQNNYPQGYRRVGRRTLIAPDA